MGKFNKFLPGGGGVGASSTATRRAKNRLATVCEGKKCFPCYTTLGVYSHNPNGVAPCTGVLVEPSCNSAMNTTGLTNLSNLNNDDDNYDDFPVNFDFYFLGTNYGNGENGGIFWCTNSVISFGSGYDNTEWDPDTGLGILIGQEDRRNNRFWYSGTLTSGSLTYVRLLYFGQNEYDDGTPNVLQYEIIMGTNLSYQYIQIRTVGVGTLIGLWNIADGSQNFLDTCGDFDTTGGGPIACGSYLFRSDLTGNNWEFFPNSSIP
jgi:hypothetical protein